jgi:hypothetical protein
MSKVGVSMRDFRRGDEGSTKMGGNNNRFSITVPTLRLCPDCVAHTYGVQN